MDQERGRSGTAVTALEQQAGVAMAAAIRRLVIERSRRANVGHIGSALSIADLIAAMYAGPLRDVDPEHPRRPRFVLSKGHAALALYAALYLQGVISEAELNAYCMDGSLVGVHPERELRGVDFSTGSLGQGLTFAVGAALAASLDRDGRRTWALVSDAECNEGSVWEAAMFAAHHALQDLWVLADVNGQQALGYVADVQDPGSLTGRWLACGWRVMEVDGHDHEQLEEVLARPPDGRPTVVLARTTFGHGVSFMERRIEWHYLPMTEEQYHAAIAELGG
jgi:transketolase